MIKENLLHLRETLPANVKLIAVSKTKPATDIQQAYDCGQLAFGENKAQELRDKRIALPQDIEWHFLGHLQTNKIKYLFGAESGHTQNPLRLIHGIDSLRLLEELNTYADKHQIDNIRVLLQVHIAQEETKFGFSRDEILQLCNTPAFASLTHINVCGLMGVATNTPDESQVHNEFAGLRRLFEELKSGYFANNAAFSELSMGMTGDYRIAIEEGSTMVRIGSAIFGERDYSKSYKSTLV